MCATDVLLVGPYPPPFGGIATHVQRLAQAIEAEGLTVRVLNHFRTRVASPLIQGDLRRNPVRYWYALRVTQARLVHYHHSRWSTLIATAFALSRQDRPVTAITVHDHSLTHYIDGSRPLRGWLVQRALKCFDVIVAVSPEIARELGGRLRDQPTYVIPAYVEAVRELDTELLSDESSRFLRAGHPTLLVAGYGLMTERTGQTVYGLEFGLDVFIALAEEHRHLRLAIFLAQGPRTRAERARLGQLRMAVADAQLGGRFCVMIGEALAPAFSYDCIFLRPSTTDGDAVSIREALAANTPVIASDVVVRPAGVESLPLRRDAWVTAIRSAIGQLKPARAAESAQATNPGEDLIRIYRSFLCR